MINSLCQIIRYLINIKVCVLIKSAKVMKRAILINLWPQSERQRVNETQTALEQFLLEIGEEATSKLAITVTDYE